MMVEALISGSGGFDYFICQFTLTSLCVVIISLHPVASPSPQSV